jgi:nicotinate-nucleotide adenylyltransferase
MTKRKIALFGGTFDPIHLGHTAVAAAVAEYIGAEKIVFLVARFSPLKNSLPGASGTDRLQMTALAIAEHKNFQLSDYELNKPQPSYTLETVRHFQADYGSNTSIYWLVGADSVDDLPRWYRIRELIDQCNLCVMHRAGYGPVHFARFSPLWGSERVGKLQRNIIQTPLIDISSTEIRNRLAAGKNVSNMLHPAVADYIYKHGLYQKRLEH